MRLRGQEAAPLIFLYCFLGVFAAFSVFAALCVLCVSGQADEMEERMWLKMMAEKQRRDESDDCVDQREE